MKVFIIAALTADGYIGLDESHRATSWTTKADKIFFVKRTKEAGTVVMGRKTFDTFGKPLKDRRLIILTSIPESITVEGVEGSNESAADLVARLEREGVKELAVCGGASVYTQFLEAGLVDEIYLTIMPKIFGTGVPLFGTAQDADLELIQSERLEDGNSVLVHYRVIK
jgi:dihydrofolate reductase